MNIHYYNKLLLNLILLALVYMLYVNIEENSTTKQVDYTNSTIALSGLLIFGFIRYYYEEFKELLMTKK